MPSGLWRRSGEVPAAGEPRGGAVVGAAGASGWAAEPEAGAARATSARESARVQAALGFVRTGVMEWLLWTACAIRAARGIAGRERRHWLTHGWSRVRGGRAGDVARPPI